MSDLPDDVREYLEAMATGFGPAKITAGDLLAKWTRPQPELAWQDGDVVFDVHCAWLLDYEGIWRPGSAEPTADEPRTNAEPLFVGGRRVHPARFAEHAVYLRKHADWLESEGKSGARFRTIAADLASDNDA